MPKVACLQEACNPYSMLSLVGPRGKLAISEFSSVQFSSGEPISRPIWQHLSAKPSKPAFISNKVDIFIILRLTPESDRVQNSGSERGWGEGLLVIDSLKHQLLLA